MPRVAKTAAFLLLILCGVAHAEVKVQTFGGKAETKLNGEWRLVEVGQNLKDDSELRTGADGHIQFKLPDGSFARLLESSECKLTDISKDKKDDISIELVKGSLVMSVSAKGLLRKIFTPKGVAIEGKGILSVAVNDDRTMVSVLKGEACAIGRGDAAKTCVKSEQDMEIVDGSPGPTEKMHDKSRLMWKEQKFMPGTDDRKLSLKVHRPEENKHFDESGIVVSGKTLPGSQVRANGKQIQVKDNGSFSGSITLFEGENRLSITATAPDGETVSTIRTVFLDTTPPLLMVNQPVDNFDPSMFGNCDSRRCYIQVFGLTEPGVMLNINGLDVSRFISDDGSFLIQDFPILFTESLLTVYAQDTFGRRTHEVLHMEQPADSDGDGTFDYIDGCPNDPGC